MPAVRKQGKTILSADRNVILNVIKCCEEESKNKRLRINLNKSTERASNYCNVSVSTIKRIRKEKKSNESSSLSTPGKTRKRPEYRNAVVDDFDRRVIKEVIEDFYLKQKIVPTCKKMIPVLQTRIDFQWKACTLRKILKEMGFRWKTCTSKRKILIERQDIVNLRCKYLQKMKKIREDGKNVLYLDETWADTNLTFRKCWQSENVMGIMNTTSASNRFIVAHIGGRGGFINGCELIFRAGTATGDYHGQMNSDNFEKWLIEKVIPKLQTPHVVVMDNAPYHGKQTDKPPTKYSLKKDMISYLIKNGIECNENMRKVVLYDLVLSIKPKEKIFRVDKLFAKYGHSVVRLPPYMCELNPIELAWSKVKYHIRTSNTSGDMSLSKLQQLVQEGIQSVSEVDWISYCNHVERLEKDYFEKDGLVEDACKGTKTLQR